MDWIKEILNGMTVTQKNGVTITVRALMFIGVVICAFGIRQYNNNIERQNALIALIVNDINKIKEVQAVAVEYKQTDIFQHNQIYNRLEKAEGNIEQNGQDIAELLGFTGLKSKRFN